MPLPLYPRERPGTRCVGGWVGPRAGLDGRKISSSPGFFCKYIFIVPSVDKYNCYVGGSSVTWCVWKSVFECRICDNCCFVSHGPKRLPVSVATSSVGGVFTGLVLGGHVPLHGEMWYCQCVCVSQITVSPGNSQLVPADAPFDMLSTGHAAWSQHSRWVTTDSDVVYGNTPCGRGSTKLPLASGVAKSENLDERSIPVEYVVGQYAGWSLFWNGSTSKCRSLRYTQSADESECLVDCSVGTGSIHCVVS